MNSKNDIELPLITKKGVSVPTDIESPYPHKNQSKNPNHKSHFLEYFDSSRNARKYEPRASFFRWLTFTDTYPFTKKMNGMDKFEMSDVPLPEKCFDVETKMVELDYNWNMELQETRPQFMKALRRTFHREIMEAMFLTFLDNTIKVYYSIYVGDIVSIITSTSVGGADRTQDLIDSATILSFLVIIWLFIKNWGVYVIIRNIGRARLAVTGLLYKKLNSTSLTSLHEIKLGKVINLIGNDLNDMQSLHMLPAMLVNPFLIIQGTYMMWGYFGPSCLIGLLCMVLVVFGQIYFSNKTEVPRRENKKTTDERVKFTHEVIEGIRLIKMYTWDKVFKKKIEDLRQKEQETFTKMIHIDAIGRNFSSLSVYLNILVVSIAYVLVGGVLSPEKIYASMLILMYLSTSLVSSHQGRIGLVNFRMVITRIEEVLRVRDIVQVEETLTGSAPRKNSSQVQPVELKNFMGYWSHNTQKPCLSNINLTFNPGTLTAIIGRIGSGKSSLLLAFLRELPLTSGVLNCSGKVAYVEQDPIIFSGTFRDNVLFGREFDEALYRQVLSDCNLDRDLQSFKFGDLTSIGERGVNLSGGQKARVSLARALYSQSDVYLLDDPFSALDSKVSRDIFNRVLKKTLAKTKIVILVTHHLHFAKESDHVIMMDEGKVEAEGTFVELEKLDLSLLNVFKIEAQKRMSDDITRKESMKQETKKADTEVIAKTQEKGTKEEAAQVTLKTYKDYFQVKGDKRIFWELSLLFVVPHVLIVYYSRFIGYWAEEQTRFYYEHQDSGDDAQFDNSYYIGLSVIMLVVLTVISQIKTIRLNVFLLSSNSELHQRMLNSLVRAKVLFFDLNPIGRVLNRFSNDLGIMDKGNMRMIFETLENAVSHIALLITVCLINPAILLPTIFVVYGLYQSRIFFNKPMMLTKKLELAAKSPMISYVPATLQGLIIIRVYNQGGRFIREFLDLVYNNTKTFAFLTKTTRLFMLSLEAPVQLLTVSGVWIFVIGMLYYDFGPGLIGLSLMYLMKIGSTSSLMIRQSLEVDVNMQSAQRILDYCHLPSEAADYVPEKDIQVENEFDGQWPNKGEIEFNNVFLRYREELEFALKGLSLKIPGGLKIACIGRTGAGKSSIIQALFRMVEIEKGPDYRDSFIKIDGVDIHKMGLNLLRSRLSIIPQSPVIFTGTIRRNLDPFGNLDDHRIWRILEEVGLKDHVLALPNKLETDMTVSTSVFSTGQKQLVCLARAIINKSKVIILDEATANVDVETDSFIQKTIMEKFKDCTVLTIAHRLITIANYDKVVVIDNGCVAEYDTPYGLLVQRIGDSRITRQNGSFAEMVNSTGQGMAKKIFDIAKDHFLSTVEYQHDY